MENEYIQQCEISREKVVREKSLTFNSMAFMFLICNVMVGGSAPKWFGLQGSYDG